MSGTSPYTLTPLPAELAPSNEVEADKRTSFTTSIREVLGDSVKISKEVPLDNNDTEAFDALWDLEPYEDNYESQLFIPDADLKDAAGKPFVLNLWLTSKSMNRLITNYEAVYSSNG